MLSGFWGYLPYLFQGYGIFFKIIKGIWDTGTLPSRASLSLNVGQKYCRMLQESILQYYRPSFSCHPLFCLFLSGRLRQVLLAFHLSLLNIGHSRLNYNHEHYQIHSLEVCMPGMGSSITLRDRKKDYGKKTNLCITVKGYSLTCPVNS